jgi:integrase
MAVRLSDVRVLDGPENGGRKVYRIWFGKVKVSGEEHSGFVIEGAPVLSAWIKAHPSRRPDAPLFPAWNGNFLTRNGASRVVKEAAQRAGVTKRVYPHLFRHSRATHLLRLGMREGQVKKLLGWKPGSMMLARYSHLVDTDAYRDLLERQGYEVPKALDLGKLTFEEDALKAVVPMNAPPAAPTIQDEIDKLSPAQIRQLAQILDHLAAAKGA